MVWLEDCCVTRNVTRRSISHSIPMLVLVSIPSRHCMSRFMCRFTFDSSKTLYPHLSFSFLVSGNIPLMENCRCSNVHWNKTIDNKGICKFTVIIIFILQPTIIVGWLQPVMFIWASHCWHVYRSCNCNLCAFCKSFLGSSRISLVCAFCHSDDEWHGYIKPNFGFSVVVLWDSSEAAMDSS